MNFNEDNILVLPSDEFTKTKGPIKSNFTGADPPRKRFVYDSEGNLQLEQSNN